MGWILGREARDLPAGWSRAGLGGASDQRDQRRAGADQAQTQQDRSRSAEAGRGQHRARRSGSDAERARKAVGMRIRDAIAKIDHELPPLGRHLAVSIRTGIFCAYVPEHPVRWQCQP